MFNYSLVSVMDITGARHFVVVVTRVARAFTARSTVREVVAYRIKKQCVCADKRSVALLPVALPCCIRCRWRSPAGQKEKPVKPGPDDELPKMLNAHDVEHLVKVRRRRCRFNTSA